MQPPRAPFIVTVNSARAPTCPLSDTSEIPLVNHVHVLPNASNSHTTPSQPDLRAPLMILLVQLLFISRVNPNSLHIEEPAYPPIMSLTWNQSCPSQSKTRTLQLLSPGEPTAIWNPSLVNTTACPVSSSSSSVAEPLIVCPIIVN